MRLLSSHTIPLLLLCSGTTFAASQPTDDAPDRPPSRGSADGRLILIDEAPEPGERAALKRRFEVPEDAEIRSHGIHLSPTGTTDGR